MITTRQLLSAIHRWPESFTDAELQAAQKLSSCVQALTSDEISTLKAVWLHGPLPDDDLPSKSSRDSLVRAGLMVECVVKGEPGYNAVTYLGHSAHLLLQAEGRA